MQRRGFSLAELILSIGFFALAILALIALSISISRTDSKSLETSAGTLVADQLFGQTLSALKVDAVGREDFFANEHGAVPWSTGQTVNGHTTFYYEVKATSVTDAASGAKVGDAVTRSRLKKVDIHVWWAASDSTTRSGSGQLEVFSTRLVSEPEAYVDVTP